MKAHIKTLSKLQKAALVDLVKHGELLCFEGSRWAPAGFERDSSKLPSIVPLVWHRSVTVRVLVRLGLAEFGLSRFRVHVTDGGKKQVAA